MTPDMRTGPNGGSGPVPEQRVTAATESTTGADATRQTARRFQACAAGVGLSPSAALLAERLRSGGTLPDAELDRIVYGTCEQARPVGASGGGR